MAKYSDFQLKEYENISQAHFKTNEMIATFFRYYLLIMTLPVTAFGVALGIAGDFQGFSEPNNTLVFVAPVIFFILSILGFFIMCYISGLRANAILYARQVNSIRGFFRNRATESDKDILSCSVLVLPTDTRKPAMGDFIATHS